MPGRTWRDNGHMAICPLSGLHSVAWASAITLVESSVIALSRGAPRRRVQQWRQRTQQHARISISAEGEARGRGARACALVRAMPRSRDRTSLWDEPQRLRGARSFSTRRIENRSLFKRERRQRGYV